MQNAHERFGSLEFIKRMKDTTTRVRVFVDRAIVEPPKDDRGQGVAHLISMIGSDAEIGALWAGVAEGAVFQIHLVGRPAMMVSFGTEAQCFRGSVVVSNRERPVRHLVAISSDLAKTKPGTDPEGARTVLCDDDPGFRAVSRGRPVWFTGTSRLGAVVHGRTQSAEGDSPVAGIGLLTCISERQQSYVPEVDWQGPESARNLHSGREPLDCVGTAEDSSGTAAIGSRPRCKR